MPRKRPEFLEDARTATNFLADMIERRMRKPAFGFRSFDLAPASARDPLFTAVLVEQEVRGRRRIFKVQVELLDDGEEW